MSKWAHPTLKFTLKPAMSHCGCHLCFPNHDQTFPFKSADSTSPDLIQKLGYLIRLLYSISCRQQWNPLWPNMYLYVKDKSQSKAWDGWLPEVQIMLWPYIVHPRYWCIDSGKLMFQNSLQKKKICMWFSSNLKPGHVADSRKEGCLQSTHQL